MDKSILKKCLALLAIFSLIAISACGTSTPTSFNNHIDPPQDEVDDGTGTPTEAPTDDGDTTDPAEINAINFKIEIKDTTSSTVTIEWSADAPTDSINFYISPEPYSETEPGKELPVGSADFIDSEFTIDNLAAGVNIFIRALTTNETEEIYSTTETKTIGGPREVLDNYLREVHAYAPNILQIVLANGDGSTWQSGTWSVTKANGEAIGITSIHRHSIAVGAPDYSIGWGIPYSDEVIDTDHRIYLVLSENIGQQEILQIEGPAGLDFTLPFSDKYLETPVVQLNQVGYNPKSELRYAYISGWMGDGGPLDLSSFPSTAGVLNDETRNPVLENISINLRSANDADAETEVRDIDLSLLPESDTDFYRVYIPGVGVSWKTRVSEEATFELYYIVMRGLFLNRWGGDLSNEYTEWSRPQDHQYVYKTDVGTDFQKGFCSKDTDLDLLYNCDPQPYPGDDVEPQYPEVSEATRMELRGGYHDAGDYDQRPMHTVVPQLLMQTYEINPSIYKDNELNIPESGNGVPDILDEAMWGIAAWEQLQEADGGVRMGVESSRHPWGYFYANEDELNYWTYARDPRTTARAAGLFAQGSRLIKEFDATRAAELEAKARLAYAYAKANQTAATDTFLFYATSELYKLTGESAFADDFVAIWQSKVSPFDWWTIPNYNLRTLSIAEYVNGNNSMPDYWLAYYNSGTANGTIKESMEFYVERDADGIADDSITSVHAHRNSRPSNYDMDWGTGVNMGRNANIIFAHLGMQNVSADQKQKYINALSLAADYILGGNPNGLTYITGLGSRHPEEPLHLDSLAFIKAGLGPMPGIPAYGPVDSFPGAFYSAPVGDVFYPAFNSQPPARRYADVRTVVNCSEFTIWEMQAPLAQLFAALLGI